MDIDTIMKQHVAMSDWSAESFLKWATLMVSTIALLVSCVRYPLAVTLKATVQEVLRQELPRYESVAASEARWEKHQEPANEILRRLDRDVAILRDGTTVNESNRGLLVQLGNHLLAIETKLDLLLRQNQPPGKPLAGTNDP